MTEKQIIFKEKEHQKLWESVDAQKANAQAVSQLDAALNTPKKSIRPQSLRVKTDDVETQISQQNEEVVHEAKVGESIDV